MEWVPRALPSRARVLTHDGGFGRSPILLASTPPARPARRLLDRITLGVNSLGFVSGG